MLLQLDTRKEPKYPLGTRCSWLVLRVTMSTIELNDTKMCLMSTETRCCSRPPMELEKVKRLDAGSKDTSWKP